MLTYLIAKLIAIAGGGGSGGGGGGGGGGSHSSSSSYSSGSSDSEISVLGMIFVIAVFVIIGVVSFIVIKKSLFQYRKRLAISAQNDPAWQDISKKSEAVFRQHQIDWQNSDLVSMKKYMTPQYYAHTELMIEALGLLKRQNKVEVKSITLEPYVVGMNDSEQNDQDTVSVMISAYVRDEIFDLEKSESIYSTSTVVSQTYNFTRSGGSWLIGSITQPTANVFSDIDSLKQLASSRGYFYSQDWGYLLIPKRGVLFSKASFGVSDINNHVIGKYRDVLVQVYSYARRPSNNGDDYIIAQVAIPKNYGDIVVRRKKFSLFGGGMRGLSKVQMEWGEFNSMYEVFATDPEKVTSFELLHPAYMSKLRDLDYEVNIEVVDNVVYLYTPARKIGKSKSDMYESLIGLLEEAYRQMRL